MAGFKRIAGLLALSLLTACASPTGAPDPIKLVAPLPPALDESVLSKTLVPLLGNKDLGTSVGISVVDVSTGALLFDVEGQFIPASTAKLFTAAALLLTYDSTMPVATLNGKSVNLADELARVLASSDSKGLQTLANLLPQPPLEVLSFELPELDLRESKLVDANGLSRNDRTTPRTLAELLAIAWNTPRLAPLAAGLPVAGENGTMKKRAVDIPGALLAKTGTLSGVSALAGLFATPTGRMVSFAIMADHVPILPGGTDRARKAIDKIATALVNSN